MLTVELTPDGDQHEVHFDARCAEEVIRYLQTAVEHSGHDHLMTAAWGGQELSDETQGEHNKLIHHGKLMPWLPPKGHARR